MKKEIKKTLYGAYGSNLNLRQMSMRCPTAEVVGTAMLKGYELLFRGVATVEPKQGGRVPLLIWSLEPSDELALDRYEAFPSLYRKEYHNVEVDGKKVKVMIYIMNDGREISEPSQYYFEVIRQGYRSAGFDSKLLIRAAQQSREGSV